MVIKVFAQPNLTISYSNINITNREKKIKGIAVGTKNQTRYSTFNIIFAIKYYATFLLSYYKNNKKLTSVFISITFSLQAVVDLVRLRIVTGVETFVSLSLRPSVGCSSRKRFLAPPDLVVNLTLAISETTAKKPRGATMSVGEALDEGAGVADALFCSVEA